MVGTPTDGPQGWRPDLGLLRGLSAAAVVVDPDGAVVWANPAANALFGSAHGPLVGLPVGAVLLEEPERGGFGEILGQVLAGSSWSGELPMVLGTGARRMATWWAPVRSDDSVVGAVLLVEHTAGPAAHARAMSQRLGRLASVTRELLAADSLDAVTKIVTEHVTEAAGATVGSLSLLVDVDTLALVGIHGGRPGVASRWATYPLAASTPAGEAMRTRRPLVMDHTELRQRFPDLERAADGARLMVCLPLQVAGRPVGVMSLSFPGRRSIDAAEMEFFGLLADTSAQAIERLQAQDEAVDREAKLQFLAAASDELASTLDYETTLQRVAQLAVPWFADWCAISLEQDGRLRPVAVAHVDPDKVALAWDLTRRYPPDPQAARGGYAVLRSGRSELMPDLSDGVLVAAAHDEEHLRILRGLNFRSAMQVPLVARDRVLGVLTWVAGEQGRRFDTEDLAFGEDLARRAAVAIDNAELHTELRQVAVRLQRSVLPDTPPELPGWEVAVQYLPAGRTEASGDFYEVMPLDRERVVVFVGDVMGRGVQAAAAMAQMRAAVRALAAVDSDPGWVLSGLDRLFERFDIEQLVTLVYVVLDPRLEQARVANAGHPVPLLLRTSGDVEDILTDASMILGAGGGARSTRTIPFGTGDTLLAFTDGLVERRGEDLDAGSARLLAALERARGLPLASTLSRLVEEVRDPSRDDDVALVAIRRTAVDAVRSRPDA